MWKRLVGIEIIIIAFDVSEISIVSTLDLEAPPFVLIMSSIRNILEHIGLNLDHREFFHGKFHVEVQEKY